jgi:shikimate kinase
VSDDRPLLVLIGAPAAGKTRLGKRIAKLLDVPFVDTDKRVVAAHGAIADIFAKHGESRFRELERDAVLAALGERAVVALGGGAVLNEDTRAALADHRIVQLTVSREAVQARIGGTKRPLIAGVDSWQALVDARTPIYDALATRTFDTSNRPLDDIAADIARWIQENQP